MRSNAFIFVLLLGVSLFLFPKTASPTSRFESAHSVGLDATFEGVIETDNDELTWILTDIRDQIFYTVGALNDHQGVGDIAQAKIQIISNVQIGETPFFRVTYRATMVVAWPAENTYPARWSTVVPLRVTEPGKKEFFETYGETCNSGDEDLDSDSFYYYIRPERSGCKMLTEVHPKIAIRLTMDFTKSKSVTTGKSPEYHKIWEDDALVGTLIFGNDQSKPSGSFDWGIYAAQTTYRDLISTFGKPTSSNLPVKPGVLPSNEAPYVELEWVAADGKKINMALMLVQSKLLDHASESFKTKYSERTEKSDYISYNGHSGFGDNIRELARLGKFAKGQYQIFRVYGCDTYAYVSDAIGLAHEKVNPGTKGSKYLDMITAAYPGNFGDMAYSNLEIIKALKDQKLTYKEILAKIPASSRTIVTGEEDNNWPNPF